MIKSNKLKPAGTNKEKRKATSPKPIMGMKNNTKATKSLSRSR